MDQYAKEGTLVFSATGCVGFHLLSALLRLERNCKGLSAFDSPKEMRPDCPVISYDFFSSSNPWPLKENDLGSAVFIFEEQIQKNIRPTPEQLASFLNFSKQLITTHKDIHLVYVFPYNVAKEDLDPFLELQKKITVFLSPPVVGFRDNSLMDFSIKHQKLSQAALSRNCEPKSPTGFVSSPDVVGFLISAISNKSVFSKSIRVPEQFDSVDEWSEQFKRHFQVKTSALDGVKNFFVKNSPLLECMPSSTQLDWHLNLPLAPDLFPSPLQKLDRFMKSSFENLMRNPQNPKHFPPRRAL